MESDLEFVSLVPGQILHEAHAQREFAYFPTTAILALILTTRNGASSGVAMTGRDGVVGIPLVLGDDSMAHMVAVQCAGGAYRMHAAVLRWELEQHGTMQIQCLRYTQALLAQMAQSIVCNRHHSIAQQLCRWLLLSVDQLPENRLDVTHELIGRMLGVRREGITEAAGHLQAAGLIQYHRGHVTITDRIGLEARACECYAVVRSETERLFALAHDARPAFRERPNPASLRKRAEARLKQLQTNLSARTHWETERLMHELEVHQIELEMQLSELNIAYDEADGLRREYADVYDFAPIAYLTLNTAGVITSINLAGAILLGIKHSEMGRHRLVALIQHDSLGVFEHFQKKVLNGKNKAKCEITLQASLQRSEVVVRIEGVTNESASESRLVIMELANPASTGFMDKNDKDK